MSLFQTAQYYYFIVATTIAVSGLFFPGECFAQNKSAESSLAYKKQDALLQYYRISYPDYSYEFQESFYLIQKANSGDANAQQEVALRYLTGNGLPKDTSRAVVWMTKSAELNLAQAKYNLGIFYLNGMGVKWNPFTAFDLIKSAGTQGMPEAQYLTGIFWTENLILPRNYDSALTWVNSAVVNKFKPAEETAKKLERMIEQQKELARQDKQSQFYQSRNQQQNVSVGDMDFIDASVKISKKEPDSVKLRRMLLSSPPDIRAALGLNTLDSLLLYSRDSLLGTISYAASCGSPEANVFLGRCHEKGLFFVQSSVNAARYYLHAFRLESPEAGFHLSKLLQQKDFYPVLEKLLKRKDPAAVYVYAALQSDQAQDQFGKNNNITLLDEAANKDFPAALVELGEIYFKGKLIPQDTAKAFAYWRRAEEQGLSEAKIRTALAKIFIMKDCSVVPPDSLLDKFDLSGSILSLLIQGYLSETGQCRAVDKSKAVDYYRKAAFRGNSTAYSSLKRLYNQLRPSSKVFHLPEE